MVQTAPTPSTICVAGGSVVPSADGLRLATRVVKREAEANTPMTIASTRSRERVPNPCCEPGTMRTHLADAALRQRFDRGASAFKFGQSAEQSFSRACYLESERRLRGGRFRGVRFVRNQKRCNRDSA